MAGRELPRERSTMDPLAMFLQGAASSSVPSHNINNTSTNTVQPSSQTTTSDTPPVVVPAHVPNGNSTIARPLPRAPHPLPSTSSISVTRSVSDAAISTNDRADTGNASLSSATNSRSTGSDTALLQSSSTASDGMAGQQLPHHTIKSESTRAPLFPESPTPPFTESVTDVSSSLPHPSSSSPPPPSYTATVSDPQSSNGTSHNNDRTDVAAAIATAIDTPSATAAPPRHQLHDVVPVYPELDEHGEPLLPGESLQLRLNEVTFASLTCSNSCVGVLVVTNFRLCFFLPRSGTGSTLQWLHLRHSQLCVPLGCVSHISRVPVTSATRMLKSTKESTALMIKCKDVRQHSFLFEDTATATRVEGLLRTLCFPVRNDGQGMQWLFAFEHAKHYNPNPIQGISSSTTFTTTSTTASQPPQDQQEDHLEWERQGALAARAPNTRRPLWRLSELNANFKFSPTYPQRVLIPAATTDKQLAAVGRFRSRARVPAMVWYCRANGGSIWRCSQPKVGIANSSVDDELFVENVRACTPNAYVRIMDCRAFKSAVANKAKGMGFEDDARYRSCSISFHDIKNIHTMRNAHKQLSHVLLKSRPGGAGYDGIGWTQEVEATGWLDHCRAILSMSIRIAEYTGRRGLAVVVHCSDGWDRTAQVISLAQLLLDPYFRTLAGFRTLINKDWMWFGHQFSIRVGPGAAPDIRAEERSPVFLQFLDCVWQFHHLFPTLFEFNSELLSYLADGLYSCRFGDFLSDSMKEREELRMPERTLSIWVPIMQQPARFTNPLYDSSIGVLHPRASAVVTQVRLWDHLRRASAVPTLNGHAFVHNVPASLAAGGGVAGDSIGSTGEPHHHGRMALEGAEREVHDALGRAHARVRQLEAQVNVLQLQLTSQLQTEVVDAVGGSAGAVTDAGAASGTSDGDDC